MSKKQEKEQEIKDSIQRLRKWLRPGDRVFTRVDHVSSSGMSREISCFISRGREVINISWYVARALEYTQGKNDGIKIQGCGMDMGYHIIYSLGAVLWPNGTRKPHSTHNGEPALSGGYALRHSWV